MTVAKALDDLPDSLQAFARDRVDDLSEHSDLISAIETASLGDELVRVLAVSEFAANWLCDNPETLMRWIADDALSVALDDESIVATVAGCLDEAGTDEQLMSALRILRQREWVRLMWRDLNRRAPLMQLTRCLAGFADACFDYTLRALAERTNTDITGLFVLGLGKLGGRELNFSSDIDVIYVREGDDEPDRRITRLAQRVGTILEQATGDGFAFRVDTRLRPHGKVGPLVISTAAMEHYYQSHGRDWERYALIKARTSAGDRDAGQRSLGDLQPFVYRKYLDYGAFDAIRDMQRMISSELARKGVANDVKRGRGGIRQIEFMAQTQQLIRGGRDTLLQTPSLYCAIEGLVELGEWTEDESREVISDYEFLRNVEHRLQMYNDAQTHRLPDEDDAEAWTRLAYAMNTPDVARFRQNLEAVRERVDARFNDTYHLDDSNASRSVTLWQGFSADSDESGSTLNDEEQAHLACFNDPELAHRLLRSFHNCAMVQSLSTEGRRRLDQLMPLLLDSMQEASYPDESLHRVITLLETIGRRPTYFSALIEYPLARDQVIELCGSSQWLAERLGDHPILLDELLAPIDPTPIDRNTLGGELVKSLASVDPDDTERVMERLREFRHSQAFRIAAKQLRHSIPSRAIAAELTTLADVVLQHVFAFTIQESRHRLPEAICDEPRLGVVAYGKLGSRELGFMSDVDIVFLYDDGGEFDHEQQAAYSRLSQRMISMLTTRLASGLLYEVDVRLRPSGKNGLLVSSLEAFERYQQNDAWTFEHQALVRARPLTGHPDVAERFNAIRTDILGQSRDAAKLAADVDDMRERMINANDKSDGEQLDLKLGRGALIDIEFIAQYLVLESAHEHPDLMHVHATVDILEAACNAGVLAPADSKTLIDAFDHFLSLIDQLRLREQTAIDDSDATHSHATAVREIWARLLPRA